MSRMTRIARPNGRFRIVAVLSGPEPQRTLLEDILLERLPAIPGEHLLVRGRPGSEAVRTARGVTVVPHLDSDALAEALSSAELIVSRSGYTTLMDLAAIGRNALLVPTPGQPEQEYLGTLHQRTGRFVVQQQSDIDLSAALAHPFTPFAPLPSTTNDALERALQDLATLIDGGCDLTFGPCAVRTR